MPYHPRTDVEVPEAVVRLAGGRPARLAWENELGGLTFEVVGDGERFFVKWQPAGTAIDLDAEAERMAWAVAFTPVPRVLDAGEDPTGAWLVTTAVLGRSAVTERWLGEPRTAVRAIGEGLRSLHELLPANRCPFNWSAEQRVADARRRAASGPLDPACWHTEHKDLSVEQALALLAGPPPVDRLVVCHGDACAPNTLLTDDGRCSGHVDLGAMGTADRWADLAIATWSAEWNYGPDWGTTLLDAYGVGADPDRTRYYRLLWDLGP
ncbi:MAG: aminoglycoside 3'-phosphotransferase [Acidimicrobiales bacterium]|jgi:kanamycin kinase